MCSILIVDDEETHRTLFKEILERQDYKIYTSHSAVDAIEACRLNPDIGVVLTDINLGGEMDGISLTTRLRANKPEIVTLVMTGYNEEYPIDFCMSLGIREVLYKPISTEDLLNVMDCSIKHQERRKRYLLMYGG
ncbi:response regulator [archaeon]|nr:response regulator [archaeon]